MVYALDMVRHHRKIKIFLAVSLGCAALCGAAGPSVTDPETETCTDANLRRVEAALPAIMARQIRSVGSREGDAAVDFMTKHPEISMRVAFMDKQRANSMRRLYNPDPNTMMAFAREENVFMMRHALLHQNGGDEVKFLGDRRAQKLLAHSLEMVMVHETSHARVNKEIPRVPGRLIENELLAYYRGYSFLLDVLRTEPDFDGLKEGLRVHRRVNRLAEAYDKLAALKKPSSAQKAERERLRRALLGMEKEYHAKLSPLRLFIIKTLVALAASNKDFEAIAAQTHGSMFPLDSDPEERQKAAEAEADKFEKLQEKLRDLQVSHGEKPSPMDKSTMASLRNTAAFWGDPKAIAAAKAYYGPLLAGLRAEMDSLREDSDLKAFNVPQAELKYSYRTYFEGLRGK